MRAIAALVLAGALLGGCDAPPQRDSADGGKAPPLSRWQGTELTLEEGAGKASFVMSQGEGDDPAMAVKGFFAGLPSGTAVSLGTATGTAQAGADLRLAADVRDRAGALTLRDAATVKVDLDLTLSITLPGHRPLTTRLPPLEVGSSIAALLGEARKGIVSFPGEPPHSGRARSVAVLGPASAKREMRVLGPAKQVWDIDWVAIEEQLPASREKPCRGYNRRIDVVLKMHDSAFVVHDRRMGVVALRKTFPAPDVCPREPLLNPDGSTHAYVPHDVVDRWLEQELGLK